MLSYLRIHNFQLIQQLELDLSNGFTVVTGETGAGKSMLLEALGFGLGGRAKSDWVGPHADDMTVELQWQDAIDADAVVVQRRCDKQGRSVIKLNGSLSALGELEAFFAQRVLRQDQGQSWLLKKTDYAAGLLDRYAEKELRPKLELYKTAFQTWQGLGGELRELQERLAKLDSEAELIEHQYQELQTLAEQPLDEAVLLQKRQRLLGSAKRAEHLQLAEQALDDIDGTWSGLAQLVEKLQVDLVDETWGREAATGISTYLQDLRLSLGQVSADEAADETLETIDEQLATLRQLRRKYGADLEQALQQAQRDVDELRNGRKRVAELQKNQKAAQAEVIQLGQQLSQIRSSAAKQLVVAMQKELKTLGFSHPAFKAQLTQNEVPAALGFDQIQFLFSANPDVSPGPLSQTASGGELSRLLLAFYLVAGLDVAQPLLLFDEIDVGLGGQTASVVGQRLRQLGEQCQIIAITHLPQVAACGQQHVYISKNTVQKSKR